jgi:alkylhydroperoxidase family enzyme
MGRARGVFRREGEAHGGPDRATEEGAADDPVWSRRERLIIRLADVFHETATVDDGLWSELKEEFSDEQVLELIVLAGFYHTVSFLTNALRLPLEPDAARFPPEQRPTARGLGDL